MYFLTGIDTNIGKTFISTLLMKQLKGIYFKPIQCGDLGKHEDYAFVKRYSGLPDTHFIDTIYRFKDPVSPHEAARRENVSIAIEDIKQAIVPRGTNLLIEGAGGVFVPLTKDFLMADLIQYIGAQAILVTSPRLGTFNHTLLSVHALQSKNIPIKGIIINGMAEEYIIKTIQDYTKLPILGIVPWYNSLSPFPDYIFDL